MPGIHVYVDGLNLYHDLLRRLDGRGKWLDPVALATLLVMHACRRVFDKAIVISNDCDLALPVRTAVDLGGDVLVVHPSEYPAKALLRAGARVEKLWTSTVLS